MDRQPTLQTVDRALMFLEQVATATVPPSVKDIAAILDLNLATCYHLMRTLEAHDYLRKADNGGLVLGVGVEVLVRGYETSQTLEACALPYLESLVRKTRETTFLSVREDDKVVLKRLLEGTRSLRVAGLYEGLAGQEYQRASGKCVLANLQSKEREILLKAALAGKNAGDKARIREALKSELVEVKARGLAFDRQTEEGIVAIGATIFGPKGSVIGAVGIVMPAFRLESDEKHYLESVRSAAVEVSRALKQSR